MNTWVEGATGSHYDIDHLPYGAFSVGATPVRLGSRIGDWVLDLGAAARDLKPEWVPLLDVPTLNHLMSAPPSVWAGVREWIRTLLSDTAYSERILLYPVTQVSLRLPWAVADYVDYYASEHHASNVGKIFRPDQTPLLPNWKHLPVGYHGRSGSVIASGTNVRRPCGQRKEPTDALPTYGPSQRLDLEAELGFVVGRAVPLGQRVTTSEFAGTVFGVVGVNDWSARDIQAWEYVPLGPNLAKSFATSVSAWVTPLDALEGARMNLPAQVPEVLDYLKENDSFGYDITVEIELNGVVVSRPPYASMYWSPAQMLAHMTVNGASLRTGDFFASGTISGPGREERGSLLELSWGGHEPFMVGGIERSFLEDGDEVVLRYTAPSASGGVLALGEVRATILPAVM
jgi:fumarylacetoacetase